MSSISETHSDSTISQSTAYSLPEESKPVEWQNSRSELPMTWDDLEPPPKQTKVIDDPIDVIEVPGHYDLPVVTNETPLADAMSKVDMATVMFTSWNAFNTIFIGYDTHPSLYNSSASARIPVNFLRQTKDGCYYTVNKVKDGGWAYFFFERRINALTKEYQTDDLTEVYLTGCVYMENTLEYADFATLKTGDSIDKVVQIDSAAKIIISHNEWEESITGHRLSKNATAHLLKDGILSISYEYSDGDGYIISDMVYSPDFVFYPISLGEDYPKYFGILPQDYPPET